MRHRDRVAMALARELPDRCPMQVSFTPEFSGRLREDLTARGILEADGDPAHPADRGTALELERAAGSDLVLTWVGYASGTQPDEDEFTDRFGISWRRVAYNTRYGIGHYTEMVGHPLADDAAIEGYSWPDPDQPGLYADAERVVREYGDEYWIVGVVVTTIWEAAWALRGYEHLLMDFVTDPDLADRVLEIPFRYHLKAAEHLARRGVDMIWTGDDLGAQHSMLFSPATWRRFLKPRMAELISRIKAINPNVLVAYHSDGDIHEVIPELIEIGIDVLNPVQPASMDPAALKRQYGDRLLFWGSIDEQQTLPFGTSDDVRAETRQRIETIGEGGGLILGPTHFVQLDTSLDNYWAMVDTIRETPYR